MGYAEHFEHRRAPDLDGARGVLAFCVVLLHLGFNSFMGRVTHGAFNGFVFGLAVDAFFILSGFVLTASVTKDPPSFARLVRKRFLRLAPVFYVTLLALFALPAGEYPWPLVPLEVLAAQPFLGNDALNFPSWSVTWEFYLPLLAYGISSWLPPISTRSYRLLFIFAIVVVGTLDIVVVRGGFLYFPRAAAGLLVGHCLLRADIRVPFRWRAWMTPGLLGLLLLLMLLSGRYPLAALAFPATVCCLILSGARNDSWLLSSRPVQWLGAISYTLYMVHIPVLRLGEVLLGHWFGQNALAKLMGIAVSLAAASALTRFVEVPFLDYSRRTDRNRREALLVAE